MMVEYYYDAYGNIINITDSSGINLSNINPFRYRSYYYDNETGSSTLGTFLGTFLGETIRFLIDYGPKFKLGNFKDIMIGVLTVVLKTAVATISSIIAGKIVKNFSNKKFSSKQIKNYFKNTKYLKSAFGIGSGGKTAKRMWFADAGITTILYNILS